MILQKKILTLLNKIKIAFQHNLIKEYLLQSFFQAISDCEKTNAFKKGERSVSSKLSFATFLKKIPNIIHTSY